MRIYIESTIPSYVVARPARDLLQAARQELTRDWWDSKREQHELFTSQVVLDEIAAGEPAMAKRRLELVAELPLLDLTADAESLAEHILRSGLLPNNADGDAAHIALATVHKTDILLTWNCRHIANAAIVGRLRRFVDAHGYTLPEITHPKNSSANNMKKTAEEPTTKRGGDIVLQEIWRIKDDLSAAREHDVHRLFTEARERQKRSTHRVVNLQAGHPNS